MLSLPSSENYLSGQGADVREVRRDQAPLFFSDQWIPSRSFSLFFGRKNEEEGEEEEDRGRKKKEEISLFIYFYIYFLDSQLRSDGKTPWHRVHCEVTSRPSPVRVVERDQLSEI
jgi:hypothetical protein